MSCRRHESLCYRCGSADRLSKVFANGRHYDRYCVSSDSHALSKSCSTHSGPIIVRSRPGKSTKSKSSETAVKLLPHNKPVQDGEAHQGVVPYDRLVVRHCAMGFLNSGGPLLSRGSSTRFMESPQERPSHLCCCATCESGALRACS